MTLLSLALGFGDDLFDLAPGSYRTVVLTYSPQVLGDDVSTLLRVVATDPRGFAQEKTVDVVGTARELTRVLEVVSISSPHNPISLLDFGTLELGENLTQPIRVQNIGEDTIVGSIEGLYNFASEPCWWDVCFYVRGTNPPIDGDTYTLTAGTGPGTFIDLDVTFTPSRAWPVSTGIVDFEGGDEVQALNLRVEATDPSEESPDAHLLLSPVRHDFGNLTPGESGAVILTLRNTGSITADSGIQGLEMLPNGTTGCRQLVNSEDGICFEPSVYVIPPNGMVTILATFTHSESSDIRPFLETFLFAGGAQPATFTATGSAANPTQRTGSGVALPTELGLRGFVNSNTFLSSGDIDHVNTLNGNLVVTLPIGPPQSIGPSLSHGLSLVYNSNAWDAVPEAGISDGPAWGNWWQDEPSTVPSFGTNAGLGWQLSLGTLYQPLTQSIGFPSAQPHWPADHDNHWAYVGPDGSKVYFEADGTAPNGDQEWISIGNQRLRMTESTSTSSLEFPDGSRHTFSSFSPTNNYCPPEAGSNGCWKLTKIEDAYGNFATVGYINVHNSGSGSGTASVSITYPHGRVVQINYDKIAVGVDPSLVPLRLKNVTFPSGIGTYSFNYDEGATVTRGCISGVGQGGNISLDFLNEIQMPEGLTYKVRYVADTTSGECDSGASVIETIDLPTQARIQYEWIDVFHPGVCEGSLPDSGGGARTLGVSIRRVFENKMHSDPVASTSYFYSLTGDPVVYEDPFYEIDGPTPCSRQTTAATDVIHWPDVIPGDGVVEKFLGERFYHALLRPTPSDSQPDPQQGDQWIKAVHGLPVDMHTEIIGAYSRPLWLHSESGDCSIEEWSSCTVRRQTYRHYEILENSQGAAVNGWDRPFEDKVRYQRRRDAMNNEQQRYLWGGDDPIWVESLYENWDGRGHYRTARTKSNFKNNSPETTETTNYHGTQNVGQLNDDHPSGSWLLNLFDKKISNTTGNDRVTEFDFNTGTGFLTCHRVWRDDDEANDKDLLTGYGVVSTSTNGHKGLVSWQGITGGDYPGGAGDGDCSTDKTSYHQWIDNTTYTAGILTSAQPMVGNSAIGPKTVDIEVDSLTGRITESCDNSTSPVATCETYTYDGLGRRLTVDRGRTDSGAKPALEDRLADSKFEYTLDSEFGAAEVVGTLYENGTSGFVDSERLILDGLGREIQYRQKSLATTGSSEVISRSFYHGRGFKTQEVTPVHSVAGDRPCKIDDSFCHSSNRYDVYGQLQHSETPSLNDMDAPTSPGVRQTTTYGVNEFPTIPNYEIVKRSNGGDQHSVGTNKDHLGRTWRTKEKLKVAGGANQERLTYITWKDNRTTVSRKSVGGVNQKRKIDQDGRGFLTREQHPEWNDGFATYEYDALGNLWKEHQPNGGPIVTTNRDALGRPDTVYEGNTKLKEFDYDSVTGKLTRAIRFNYMDCSFNNTSGCSLAVVTDDFSYDSNGQVSQKDTSLVWRGDTLYSVTQEWTYDAEGRVETTTYPDCTEAYCGPNNGSARSNLVIGTNYVRGDLESLTVGTTPLATFSYHPSGVLDTVDYYDVGVRKWQDVQRTPDSGVARVESIQVYKDGTPSTLTWDSGEITFNADGMLDGIHGGTDASITLGYDAFFRLDSYLRSDENVARTYTFDNFDNLLSMSKPVNSREISDTTNQMTKFGGTDVLSDHRGFVVQMNTTTMEYDAFGQMVHYNYPKTNLGGPYEALYFYDAADQRVATIDRVGAVGAAEQFVFMGRDHSGKILREFRHEVNSSNWSYKDFLWAGSQLRLYDDGTSLQYAHLDHLGSTRLVTDPSSVVTRQEYGPWGTPIDEQTSMPFRMGFTGHEMDLNHPSHPGDDGFSLTYDFGARSYTPVMGRFLTPDPARDPSSWSLYGYAGNSPFMAIDPDGREAFKATGSIALAAPDMGIKFEVGVIGDGHGNVAPYFSAGPGVGIMAEANFNVGLGPHDTIFETQGIGLDFDGGFAAGGGGIEVALLGLPEGSEQNVFENAVNAAARGTLSDKLEFSPVVSGEVGAGYGVGGAVFVTGTTLGPAINIVVPEITDSVGSLLCGFCDLSVGDWKSHSAADNWIGFR